MVPWLKYQSPTLFYLFHSQKIQSHIIISNNLYANVCDGCATYNLAAVRLENYHAINMHTLFSSLSFTCKCMCRLVKGIKPERMNNSKTEALQSKTISFYYLYNINYCAI